MNQKLMNMYLSIQGSRYICDSISRKYGATAKDFHDIFKDHMNGNHVFTDDSGYTNECYCLFKGDISTRTNFLLVIESDVNIKVGETKLLDIFTAGKCNINIESDYHVSVIAYGNDVNVISANDNIAVIRN